MARTINRGVGDISIEIESLWDQYSVAPASEQAELMSRIEQLYIARDEVRTALSA